MEPIVRHRHRIMAAAMALALLATLSSGAAPAVAQQGQGYEFRVAATGEVTATATYMGRSVAIPTNTEHPYGAVNEVRLTMQGVGTCRITVNGRVVSEHPGPLARCQYP